MQPQYIGGQAVIEGVMMRAGSRVAIAVRTPDNRIHVETEERSSLVKKWPVLNLPLIRGTLVLYESTVLGMQALAKSAQAAGEEDATLNAWQLALTMLASFLMVVCLFLLVPVFVANWLAGDGFLFALVEGGLRLAIFVGYIGLIARMKDVQRLFQYHGAEHKTINCYEAGEPLTVENVRKHSLLHKRCGTSFLLFVTVLSVFLFALVSGEQLPTAWKILIRITLLPLLAGVAYELIRWSAEHSGRVARWLSWPGLWLQKWTTREPDDSQIEVAIASTRAALNIVEPVEASPWPADAKRRAGGHPGGETGEAVSVT